MDDFTEIMNRPNETMSDAFKKMNAAKEFFLGIYNKGFQEGHEVAMKKLEL